MAVLKQISELIDRHAPQLADQYGHVAPKLAQIYADLGLTNDALATYDAVARRLQNRGRDRDAVEIIRRMLALERSNPLPYLRLAESLLAGLGAVAAEAGGCFLGAADPVLWGCDDLARHPDRGDWVVPDRELAARLALLRGSAVAPFIGLCAPRVLGRLPYGKRSDPVDSFDFTELGEDPPHTAFLWLNGAYGCAQLIIASWAEGREPGSVVDLNDLPQAVYRFAGGDAIKPCAEVYLDESSADRILGCGVMPLMSYRNRNAVRLLRLQSIASPAAALAFGKALA